MANLEIPTASSPGQILKEARERYDWTIEEVAAELNLLPHIVEALENDNYDDTAGWTYAVGYLRNYARLLGISIEEVLKDKKEILPPKDDGPGSLTEGLRRNRQPIAIHYRWVITVIVVFMVVGGLYAAYLNRSTDVQRGRLDLADQSRNTLSTNPVIDLVEEGSKKIVAENKLLREQENKSESTQDKKDPPSKDFDQKDELVQTPNKKDSKDIEIKEEVRERNDIVQKIVNEKSYPRADKTKTMSEINTENNESVVENSKESSVEQNKNIKSDIDQDISASKDSISTVKTITKVTKKPKLSSAVVDRFVYKSFSTGVASNKSAKARITTNAASKNAISDSRRLTLRVRESTHVVVWDRNDKILFRRYVESGKIVSLAGEPPFTLKVSYPEGATIIYRGKEHSIPSPRSGRDARVQIGR